MILVVSQDPQLQEEVRFGFPEDLEVRALDDARGASAAVGAEVPTLVIVEMRTGSAGGFSLARDLDQLKQLRDVPVLMLLERDQDRWLARQAGADAILVQPVTAADLVAAARPFLGEVLSG